MELIPAVVQHAHTGQVLMVAFMNDEALKHTQHSGVVHFWSRSRKRLWRKGESSGHTLKLVELRLDCDNDCLLVRAEPTGPVCHTGHGTCFFSDDDEGAPASMLDAVYQVILDRKRTRREGGSYTRELLNAGPARVVAKIREECEELCAELPRGGKDRVVSEAADLVFHVLVGLGARDVDPAAVLAELARRFGTSGLAEKSQRERTGTVALGPAARPKPAPKPTRPRKKPRRRS